MAEKQIIPAVVGLSGGFVIAGGVIALMVGLGIITRFVGITHTAKHVKGYETAILAGAIFGNLLTVHQIRDSTGNFWSCADGCAVWDFCWWMDPGTGRNCQYFSHLCQKDRHYKRLQSDCDRDRSRKNGGQSVPFLQALGHVESRRQEGMLRT